MVLDEFVGWEVMGFIVVRKFGEIFGYVFWDFL